MTLIGNIISFFGCLLMVAVGFIKRKDHMLAAQCAQFSIQSAANLVLGSVTGCISGLVGIVRILVFRWVKVTAWLKLGFIALQAGLTWWAGADTIIQWLPFLAMVPYTWFLDTENPVIFKTVNLIGVIMWFVHDLWYLNYSAVTFDILTMISTVVGIVLLLREKKGERNES